MPILALLAARPAHGYELKRELEERFGEALPPLNAGQVYTTLQRLERDGLVQGGRVSQDGRPNKRVYEPTAAGREVVREWVETPTPAPAPKHEFFMKLVLADTAGIADRRELIERQRRQHMQALHELNAIVARADGDRTTALLAEGAALHLEADLKWLSLCEEQMT